MASAWMEQLKRLGRAAGLDFHVAQTLVLRSWSVVAGAGMVLLIPVTLSPQQQGYYFTFGSLLGLQIFFELGLNQVITQIVSHEMAHVSRPDAAEAGRDAEHMDRIRSVVKLLRKWYAAAAVLFLGCTLFAGIALFRHSGGLAAGQWMGPWLALTSATAVNLYLSPMLAVTEGCGQIGQVARLRMRQSMLGYGLAWIALWAGAGLWAVPLIASSACLCTWLWLSQDTHVLRAFDSSSPIPMDRSINWFQEVLPFQWRIAVSWMSGYLLFQLFTPLAFMHLGAATAGRLGMSISIFNTIQSIGASWINAKIPALTAHASRGELNLLDQKFDAALLRACLMTVLGCASLIIAVATLTRLGVPHIDRLADLPTLVALGVSCVANTFVYGAASYMRAYRVEPMLPVSISAAAVTLVAAYVASWYGMFPTMLSQAIVTIALVVPWTIYLFRSYRAPRGAERSC